MALGGAVLILGVPLLLVVLVGGSQQRQAEALALPTGAVVYPVPPDLVASDRHNWGGVGPHWGSWHTGTDFSVPCGTPVYASTAGTVSIDGGPDWFGSWLVKVTTGPTSVSTWYAHMQRVLVMDGATVAAGQQIGEVGDLGNTTGCHLHFEVHTQNGSIYGADNVDPSTWLTEHIGQPSVSGSGTIAARIATLNVLGASHTAPGGNSSNHIDGATRMGWLVQALQDHAVDVVGMQEFEPVQERAFERITAGVWEHFPHSDGEAGSANVVAWRTDQWRLVAADRVPIPYFGGRDVGMPFVLLEDANGLRLWVISVHNPADTRGDAQGWRDEAVRREGTLVNRLSADGTPVVLTGDMNDRARFFCQVTSQTQVHAANGGSSDGGCQPPPAMGIDWILGSPDVNFSGYLSSRGHPIDVATDHPLVVTSIG